MILSLFSSLLPMFLYIALGMLCYALIVDLCELFLRQYFREPTRFLWPIYPDAEIGKAFAVFYQLLIVFLLILHLASFLYRF